MRVKFEKQDLYDRRRGGLLGLQTPDRSNTREDVSKLEKNSSREWLRKTFFIREADSTKTGGDWNAERDNMDRLKGSGRTDKMRD